jgi:hypothetical protein
LAHSIRSSIIDRALEAEEFRLYDEELVTSGLCVALPRGVVAKSLADHPPYDSDLMCSAMGCSAKNFSAFHSGVSTGSDDAASMVLGLWETLLLLRRIEHFV